MAGRFRIQAHYSKAAIPGYPNRAIMRPTGKILYESARSQQNTVNGGLSARPTGRKRSVDRPNRGTGAIRLMAHRNRRMCFPRVSFPPCLIPAIDGIFRPGGGRLRNIPGRPGEPARIGKIGHAIWIARNCRLGSNCRLGIRKRPAVDRQIDQATRPAEYVAAAIRPRPIDPANVGIRAGPDRG